MKLLILGVNGFIGSHILERILLDTNWIVYGLDLCNNKIDNLLSNTNLHFFKGDVKNNQTWIEESIKECDIVIPLVAIANPKIYVTDPLRIFELDFEENLKIIKYCAKYNKRIIFPSTSEVYGMCSDDLFDEDESYLVTGPISMQRWIYSSSKQLLDRVIWAYGSKGLLQFTIFRPFNWVGPKLDSLKLAMNGASRLITQFSWNLLNSEPLRLIDGGQQRRCFCDIDDAINGLLSIIYNDKHRADGKIFNIGNPQNDYSIKEIANIMLQLWSEHPFRVKHDIPLSSIVNESSKVFYGVGYQDILVRKPNIYCMHDCFGFNPKIGIKESLSKTLNFFIQEYIDLMNLEK